MKHAKVERWLGIMLTVLVLPWSCIASAEGSVTPPPKMPRIDHLPSTLSAPPTSKLVFGKLIIEFERTTLDEIKRAADVGVIQHRGDAGDSENWLCYSAPFREQSQRIWISSGELGGFRHTVSHLYVEVDSKEKQSDDCPELPAQLRPVSLDNVLWLGSSLERFKEVLGTPSAKNGAWWLYSYSGKVPANGFDQSTILGVRINSGKVVGLFVSQATTN
jgi:hypothetical protein